MKLSKAQFSKITQSEGFLDRHLTITKTWINIIEKLTKTII